MKGEELKQLRKDIAKAEENLKTMKKLLEEGEKKCQHKWGETKYTPDIKPGYHIPARGQGSDFESSLDVPETVTKKWTRVCIICGKIETTTNTKFEGKEIPVFENGKQRGY